MAQFSLTDLSNRPGEVIEAAIRGPVDITRHGKRKFVLLAADHYDRMAARADVRRAYHVDNVPDDIAEMMIASLESKDE
jgi:prevent-host-death family protein